VIAPLGKRWDRGDLIPLPIAVCRLSIEKNKNWIPAVVYP